MIEKARKKAPPVNLGNKGNKNCPFREISGVGQRESFINTAIALISLITPISYFRGEYPCPTVSPTYGIKMMTYKEFLELATMHKYGSPLGTPKMMIFNLERYQK